MSRRLAVLVCGAVLMTAAPAWAQSASSPASATRVGVRAFGHIEWQSMTAADTFDAVVGKRTLQGFGGGVEVDRVWKGAFLRASVSRASETGERVFVYNTEVFRLGIPLELTMTPVEIAAGWRFKPVGGTRIVPYLGGGALVMKYDESSSADVSGEAVSESYKGFVVFGGVDVPVWRFVSAGAEVGYRKANVKSPGGALAAFDEKDLGGVTMRVMVSVGR